MAVIDLSQLPAPQIVDVPDFETLLAERKAAFVALYPLDEQDAVRRTLTLLAERKAAFLALYPKDEQAAVARTLTLESEPITNSCRKVPSVKFCCASVSTRPHRRSWWPMPSAARSETVP